ncbi:hypothetical protein DFJ73DRAFT_58024 [Zopfochytrium polystomum]|nr:hypothetical protein DFJ73DRAFT_58024 [Zopfochytrium polystomum]
MSSLPYPVQGHWHPSGSGPSRPAFYSPPPSQAGFCPQSAFPLENSTETYHHKETPLPPELVRFANTATQALSPRHQHHRDYVTHYPYQDLDRSQGSYLNQSYSPQSPVQHFNILTRRRAFDHPATASFQHDQFAQHSPAHRLYQPRREVNEDTSFSWTQCRYAVQSMAPRRELERVELSAARHKYVHTEATTHNSPIQPAADPTSDYTRRPSLPPIAPWFVDPRAPSLHRSAQPQSPSPIATSLRPPPPPTPSIPSPISPAAHLVTSTHRTPKPAKPSPKCPHGKRRAQCLSCFDLGQGGGSICAHRRRKDLCGECREYVRRGFEPPPVPGARACRRGRRRARVLVPWGVADGVGDGRKEEGAGSPRKVEAATTARGLAFSVEALLGIAGGDSGGVAAAAAADGDCRGEPRHCRVRSREESGHLDCEDDGESATPVLSPRSPPRELKLEMEGHTTIGH